MAGYFTFKSYPIIGNNSTDQKLFCLSNGIESRVNVLVRRLLVQVDPIIPLTSVMPLVKTTRASNTSGGVLMNKGAFDTLANSDNAVKIRTALFNDAPIVATAGDVVWQQFGSRQHTSIEQAMATDNNMLPLLVADTGKEFVLRPGECLLVSVIGATTATNNALANNWIVEGVWQEVDLPTFNISGVVTLSGVPVVGAKVTIVEATDKAMSNAVLKEVVTTTAGGVWSSSIRSGWVGSAFVQYENGGTLYNAPGSPFLEA